MGQLVLNQYIGLPATYEQLAEEAIELAHAALKLARIYRGENPCPSEPNQASLKVVEEFTDLMIIADDLGLKPSGLVKSKKIHRMRERIAEDIVGRSEK